MLFHDDGHPIKYILLFSFFKRDKKLDIAVVS